MKWEYINCLIFCKQRDTAIQSECGLGEISHWWSWWWSKISSRDTLWPSSELNLAVASCTRNRTNLPPASPVGRSLPSPTTADRSQTPSTSESQRLLLATSRWILWPVTKTTTTGWGFSFAHISFRYINLEWPKIRHPVQDQHPTEQQVSCEQFQWFRVAPANLREDGQVDPCK